jgi:hypothetical protein
MKHFVKLPNIEGIRLIRCSSNCSGRLLQLKEALIRLDCPSHTRAKEHWSEIALRRGLPVCMQNHEGLFLAHVPCAVKRACRRVLANRFPSRRFEVLGRSHRRGSGDCKSLEGLRLGVVVVWQRRTRVRSGGPPTRLRNAEAHTGGARHRSSGTFSEAMHVFLGFDMEQVLRCDEDPAP